MKKDTTKSLFLFWLCAVLLYFITNLQKVVMPGAIFNELQEHFSATAGSVTGIGAIFMYTYAISQLVVGLLVDRFSGARVMAWGGLVLCGGSLLSAVTPSLWLLYVARFMVGFGAASIYLSITKETSRIYPNSFAMMLGFVMVGGYLGGVMGNAPFIAGVQMMGWQQALLLVGGIATLIYLAYAGLKCTLPMPEVVQTAKFDYHRFFEVLKVRQNIHILVCGGFPFGLYFAIQSIFGKKFLEDYSGMNPESAGWVLTALMVIGAVNSLLAPALSKMLKNRRRPLMLFSGVGTAAAFLLIVGCLLSGVHSPWLISGAFILLAFAGNISPVIVALVRESNHNDIWGVMLSVYAFLAYIVTAVIGHSTGWIMELFPPQVVDGVHIYGNDSYLAAFVVLLVIALFAAYSGFRLKESNGKDISNEIK